MSTALPLLQGLLLNLFSTQRSVDAGLVESLDAGDWETVLGMVRQHRLGPMLHWRLGTSRDGLAIPREIREELAASFKRAALRALAMQRELLVVNRILAAADIPVIALKGAYLAFHAYPHPALRPLRDLDILVPKDEALRAYQALIDGGLTRIDGYLGDPAACMEVNHHLAPLRTASGQVMIELHTRLNGDPHRGDERDLWSRAISRDVAGASLRYLSPTDLALHLIAHAVYAHQFDNGPLVLGDLAYLFRTEAVDWPLFWHLATERNQTRGAVLLLSMVERFFGPQPVAWPSPAPAHATAEILESVAAQMLPTSSGNRNDIRLQHQVGDEPTMRGKLGLLLQKVFPPRISIAACFPVAATSPRVYLWYWANWWRLATKRLPEHIRSRRRPDTADMLRHRLQLQRWLEGRCG